LGTRIARGPAGPGGPSGPGSPCGPVGPGGHKATGWVYTRAPDFLRSARMETELESRKFQTAEGRGMITTVVSRITMKIPGVEEALEHLASWAARGRWKEECTRAIAEHFEPVCAKAGIDEAQLAKLLGEQHYRTIEGCAFEDFLCRRFGPKGGNVIDDYLDHRAWKESIPGRDYLRALRDSVMSLYEVVEVKPGRGLVLRDLVRGGEPVDVDERLGSESAARWDRLGVRILTMGGRHHLSGAVLVFQPEAAETVLRIFRESPERLKRTLTEQIGTLSENEKRRLDEMLSDRTLVLGEASRVITWIWLAYTIKQLKAPRPSLTNFDGEQVVFAKVRFAIAKESRAEVTQLLDGAPELAREAEKLSWRWHRPDGKETGPKAESGISLASWDESGALLLGHVELRGKWLVLEVNSVSRAERGRQLLRELLGGLIGESVTETQSVGSALEEQRSRKRSPAKDDESTLPADEAARMMREFLDRHYRRVIDEPLHATGDVSPREAVSTAEGREKVIGWLKYLENFESLRARKEGTRTYDFTWMWNELGVLEERR
jgi:hypothetical protein